MSRGKFAYITNRNTLNGYESSSHIGTERGNVITVNDFSANFGGSFYQEKNFATSYHIQKIGLKDKELNKYTALFLTTILNFGTDKYSYGRIRNLSELKKEKIILPVDEDGEIDWNYMEKMIKKLQNRIGDKFESDLLKFIKESYQ